MNKLMFILGALPLMAFASQGPFDVARLSSAAELARLAPSGALAADKPAVRTVLCGIKQDVDSVTLCIDGVWFAKDQVERKYRIKIVAVENIGVVLSSRKKVLVGQSIAAPPRLREELSKGERDEK